MRGPRFYVDQPLAAGARVALPQAVGHHARNVLRLRPGDPIVLFNGFGGEYRGHLAVADAGGPAQADIDGFDPIEREAQVAITLIQALVTSDKIDWVIEKAIELGVARIIVAPATRSTARLDGARRERRLQHWRELAIAACSQCGRNRLVPVMMAASLEQGLQAARDAHFKWILDPAAAAALPGPAPEARSAALAIGPEGGFTQEELQAASQAGFEAIALGPRILRTETAGLVAAAAWLGLNGEYAATPA